MPKLVRAQLREKIISLPFMGSMTWTAKRDSAHVQGSGFGVIYECGLHTNTWKALGFLLQKHLVKNVCSELFSQHQSKMCCN